MDFIYLKPKSYICTYEILDELLEKYAGVGQYLDVVFMRNLENAVECAIPNNEILLDYLIRVEKVSKYIDYEEYLDSQYMDSLEVVYDIQSKVLKKRHSSNSIFIQRYQNIRYKGNEIFLFFLWQSK